MGLSREGSREPERLRQVQEGTWKPGQGVGQGDTRLRLTLTREELTLNPFLAVQPYRQT